MKYSKKEAWFSHNETMPLFLLFIVGIFLFLRRLFLTTKIRRIVESTKLSAIFLHKESDFCIYIHDS